MADAAQKLDEAISFIEKSRETLKGGEVVELEGFQHEVKNICDIIGGLPVGEMMQHKDKMQELSTLLIILESELRAQQSEVQQEIFKLNQKQKALHTYQQASHSDKKEDSNA